jgi:hypothetical protein
MRRRGVLCLLNGTCIDDGANYFGRSDGTLWIKGLGHRGQYGDGRLAASPDFITTAGEAVAMQAHTGHAIYLRRDGEVLGTGGNGYGPLSSHDLGDKADRWAPIIDGARAIATGSHRSLAIRDDASLWGWGRVSASSRACGLRLCSTPRPATASRWRSTAKAGDGYGMAAARCAGCNANEPRRRAYAGPCQEKPAAAFRSPSRLESDKSPEAFGWPPTSAGVHDRRHRCAGDPRAAPHRCARSKRSRSA